jgi:TetR/AcrR family transcriptional repressor of mexJK operon
VAKNMAGAARAAKPSGQGRKRDAAKHDAIVAAARELFFARGYAAVTMDAVAAAAGVSKMTVYGHFGDKETLFAAVVHDFIQSLLAEIGRAATAGGSLAERLASVGRAFLTLICSRQVVAAHRALVPTLAADPALARRFYEAGPARMRAALAEAITAAAARGELCVPEAGAAADDLFSLWCGNLPDRLELGVADEVAPEEIAAQVARTTAVFLRAYGPA